MTKIAILTPKNEFTAEQVRRLEEVAEVRFTPNRKEIPLSKLILFCRDVKVVGFDPDNIGGFEVAPGRLKQLIGECESLSGLALATTSYGYVDLMDCKKRGIQVTNVPYYSTESVAEHTLGLMIGCAKRIFLSDRMTQRGEYTLTQGMELKGKTLGVIGLGHIGTRVAQLAQAIGMNVVGWSRRDKNIPDVKQMSLEKVLSKADVISINLVDCKETRDFLNATRVDMLKPGVIVINTASRELVNEQAMAKALISGQVDSYALEAEDLTSKPLGNIPNAFLFKGFGWYTKEALARNKQIWVDNMVGLVKGGASISYCRRSNRLNAVHL
jgi:phosphoglycerate dehydrogenase-like enzyme